MALLIKHLTLDLGSSHDLTVHGMEPHIGLCADSMETAWDSLCLCLYPSLPPSSPNKEVKILKEEFDSILAVMLTEAEHITSVPIFSWSLTAAL